MSKLMLIVGILMLAVAIALGLMIFFSLSSVIGWGLNPETVVTLLVGGVLAVGLGGVIQAIERGPLLQTAASSAQTPVAAIPEFGRKPAEAALAATQDVSPAVSETIRALEQAKSDIRQALGAESFAPSELAPAVQVAVTAATEEVPAPAEPPVVETPAAVEAVVVEAAGGEGEEEQLYVIEERVIRGRPARLLSDGTVEAETEEGWMRFENLEHLDEYLDAMEPEPRT
ncbi:MAG: hypothetical protein HY245_10405 [Rhizobiales bacterium]|nr:hypothetical protein [Hyphomicrobiales bacterium]MBI3673809.1 hypothetical protein [Hyphomicrobiales bacterium]